MNEPHGFILTAAEQKAMREYEQQMIELSREQKIKKVVAILEDRCPPEDYQVHGKEYIDECFNDIANDILNAIGECCCNPFDPSQANVTITGVLPETPCEGCHEQPETAGPSDAPPCP